MGYETISIAEKQKNSALQTISWKIDTTNKEYGLPVILFNAHSFENTVPFLFGLIVGMCIFATYFI
jgi:hypothetical protein